MYNTIKYSNNPNMNNQLEKVVEKDEDIKVEEIKVEVYEMDKEYRDCKLKGDNLRGEKNKLSSSIGALMREKKLDEANSVKEQVSSMQNEIDELTKREEELELLIKEKMMMIPNIIAPDVPIGEDDSKNVEEKRFGKPTVPNYEIPYHSDIMASFNGLDKDAAGRVSGNGFYYLMGDIARLHQQLY